MEVYLIGLHTVPYMPAYMVLCDGHGTCPIGFATTAKRNSVRYSFTLYQPYCNGRQQFIVRYVQSSHVVWLTHSVTQQGTPTTIVNAWHHHFHNKCRFGDSCIPSFSLVSHHYLDYLVNNFNCSLDSVNSGVIPQWCTL